MNPFLTPVEQIVINLVFEWLGESRINRTLQEIRRDCPEIPKIEAAQSYVNDRLKRIAKTGVPYDICDFRAGDASVRYRPFPKSISRETVRTAMKKFGVFQLRKLYPPSI